MRNLIFLAFVLSVALCCNPTLTQNFGNTADFLAELTINELPSNDYEIELLTYLYRGLPATGNAEKIACIDVENSSFELTEDTRNLDFLGISIYCDDTGDPLTDPCTVDGIDGAEVYLSSGEAIYTHSTGAFNVTSTRKITLNVDTAKSDGNFAVASNTVSRVSMLHADMPIAGFTHRYRCFGEHDRLSWQILNTNIGGAYDDFAKNITYDFPTTIS